MSQPPQRQHSDIGTTFEKTKDARYHAHERLNRKATWKGILLSLLSGYILILSVYPRFISGTSVVSMGVKFDFMLFSASLTILIISVILAFDIDKVRAQGLRDNAWRIGTIFHEYKHAVKVALARNEPPPLGEEQYARYIEAIEACVFRHEPLDYTAVEIRLAKKRGDPYRIRKLIYLAEYSWSVYGWPLLCVAMPLLGATAIASTLPS